MNHDGVGAGDKHREGYTLNFYADHRLGIC